MLKYNLDKIRNTLTLKGFSVACAGVQTHKQWHYSPLTPRRTSSHLMFVLCDLVFDSNHRSNWQKQPNFLITQQSGQLLMWNFTATANTNITELTVITRKSAVPTVIIKKEAFSLQHFINRILWSCITKILITKINFGSFCILCRTSVGPIKEVSSYPTLDHF